MQAHTGHGIARTPECLALFSIPKAFCGGLMNHRPYLLFQLNGGHYGIPAQAIQELFLLPALTPIAEAVTELVGILNLRGQIVPVIDLKQRLGQPRQPYNVRQSVLLIRVEDIAVGVIVDEVLNVEFIAATDTAQHLSHHLITQAEQAVTAGLAQHQDQLVTLLNATALVRGTAGGHSTTAIAPAPPTCAATGTHDAFLAQFAEPDQQLLQTRAAALISQTESDSLTGFVPLAVVGLQNEYFALPLDLIQEFTDVNHITPIPCCPPHIVGNMNLRGEILTLVDIRPFLNLSMAAATRPEKAVIVKVDQIVAGLIVDAVFDVVYVPPDEMTGVPSAVHAIDNEYVRSVTAYHSAMMSILDIAKLLTQGDLAVDQAA